MRADTLEIGAAYVRVSTDDQTELSPDAQIRVIRDTARQEGFIIPEDFIFMEKKDDIKKKIVGHWGTVPGQNFIYTHLNRIINKYDLSGVTKPNNSMYVTLVTDGLSRSSNLNCVICSTPISFDLM